MVDSVIPPSRSDSDAELSPLWLPMAEPADEGPNSKSKSETANPIPAPVRVPGAESMAADFPARVMRVLGAPLLVMEPASWQQRFYQAAHGNLGLLYLIVLGLVIPGCLLTVSAITNWEDGRPIAQPGILVGVAILLFWLPLVLFFANAYLVSRKTAITVYQQGLHLRYAPRFFFQTVDTMIPYSQVAQWNHRTLMEGTAGRQGESWRPARSQSTVPKGDLQLITQTGNKHHLRGFRRLFRNRSLDRFDRIVSQWYA